jgi:hypothetical protein
MEVLLEDIKRTLGAKRIFLPGSTEQLLYASKKHRNLIQSDAHNDVDELEVGVQSLGLGIVDSAVDMRSQLGSAPPNGPPAGSWMRSAATRQNLQTRNASGESDKENVNMSVLRSRIMKVKEGRSGGLEMAVVP